MSKKASAIKLWLKRHRVLCVVISIILVVTIILCWWVTNRRTIPTLNQKYEFVRTVTLSRTSLDETVSTSGTVESSNTSTVSYSGGSGMGASALTVKTVHVAVGDTVKEGDVIVSLDDTDIRSSISDEENTLSQRVATAKKSLEQAEDSYDDAYDDYVDAKDNYSDANASFNTVKSNYNKVISSVSYFQSIYNIAVGSQEKAGLSLNEAKTNLNIAVKDYNNALESQKKAREELLNDPQNKDLQEKVDKADETLSLAEIEKNNAQTNYTQAEKDYNLAFSNTQDAQNALNEAKKSCNYDSYVTAYNNAQNTYNNALNQLNSASSKLDSASEQLDKAEENYEDSKTSQTLEDLYEQLENVQLKAKTNGKITALNVGVGDTPSGVVATIQDTDSLKISVTIQEADINDVKVGMTCRIQSDATENVISGTLTQLDPVSSQNGVFGAEITVNEIGTGLLVGMNASVEIVLTTTEDCFSVPIDAVGNDEQGNYIYRSTGGSGVDMTFEKVYVTTGDSNDYYIEIDSDELSQGDVIRASADLTQGIETVGGEDEEQNPFGSGGFTMPGGSDFGNFGGSNGGSGRPSGGNMPSDSGRPNGGNVPSGTGMPSGGGFPQ